MSGFKIPINFSRGNFYDSSRVTDEEYDNKSLEKSISDFIKLLVDSPNGSFKPDAQFGFSLKKCHFENTDSKDEIREKKIKGRSDNVNYAKDLRDAIMHFEPRLQNVNVDIDFDKQSSKGIISISGTLANTKKEYKQDIRFHIWKNNEDTRRIS
jgi:hypothetical protein